MLFGMMCNRDENVGLEIGTTNRVKHRVDTGTTSVIGFAQAVHNPTSGSLLAGLWVFSVAAVRTIFIAGGLFAGVNRE